MRRDCPVSFLRRWSWVMRWGIWDWGRKPHYIWRGSRYASAYVECCARLLSGHCELWESWEFSFLSHAKLFAELVGLGEAHNLVYSAGWSDERSGVDGRKAMIGTYTNRYIYLSIYLFICISIHLSAQQCSYGYSCVPLPNFVDRPPTRSRCVEMNELRRCVEMK